MAAPKTHELIDWHCNLWLPEHYPAEHWQEMVARMGPKMHASPADFEAKVANTAEKFVLVAMKWPRLGTNIPNDFVAAFNDKHKGRSRAFACVDPFEPNAPEELRKAVRNLGMSGLKMSPVYAGYDPWCKEAWRLYEVADDLRIPILWHQSAAYPAQSMHEFGNPTLIDKIARAFPKMRMIIAHVGQPWIGETITLLRKHEQLYSDLSARYYRKWQCYNALMLALDYKVTDKLLFGSDFPIQTTQEALDSFRDINNWGPGVTMPRFPTRSSRTSSTIGPGV